ncbi:MAG: TRAP transporter small permease subunit, partial [Rhizobiaceae bacterium]
MRNFMQAIRPVLSMISRSSLWIAGIGMVSMTLIVGWQVFSRYILNDSPSWSEPLSLYLMSWFIMLGAAVGV